MLQSDFSDFVKRFNTATKESKTVVIAVLNKFALDQLKIFTKTSPVGLKSGGSFRANWKLADISGTGVLWGKKIYNNMPYAEPLVYGSPVGGRPWPNAGPRTTKKGTKIFSKQAPEGMSIDPNHIRQVEVELIKALTSIFTGK